MASVTARRWWSKEEDSILRREFEAQEKNTSQPTDWRVIASKLPDRSNKDCRKRWSKISTQRKTGAWCDEEDDALQSAVKELGTHWTAVAQRVQTRNADQCSKRWFHSLDPTLDRSEWTSTEDQWLLASVIRHGRNWKAISLDAFPNRSLTALKNRYSVLENSFVSALKRKAKDPGSSTLPTPASEKQAETDEEEPLYFQNLDLESVSKLLSQDFEWPAASNTMAGVWPTPSGQDPSGQQPGSFTDPFAARYPSPDSPFAAFGQDGRQQPNPDAQQRDSWQSNPPPTSFDFNQAVLEHGPTDLASVFGLQGEHANQAPTFLGQAALANQQGFSVADQTSGGQYFMPSQRAVGPLSSRPSSTNSSMSALGAPQKHDIVLEDIPSDLVPKILSILISTPDLARVQMKLSSSATPAPFGVSLADPNSGSTSPMKTDATSQKRRKSGHVVQGR